MRPSRQAGNGGCWTCKLRRKKCDEASPMCGDCSSLDIDCKYGSKPPWMDGGDRQKQRALSLKDKIKRNAARRREKALNSTRTKANSANHQFNVISDITTPSHLLITQPAALSKPDDQTSMSRTIAATNQEPTLIASMPWSHQQQQRSETLEQASASELNFIMKYFDFVFLALFPFHQPHIFDTGRSWLLILLRKNKIAYHATLGLSCYYFTMALSDAEEGSEYAVCKQLRWEEVEKETERCFDSLRADVITLGLNPTGMPVMTTEKVELMNSITQIIIFEMAIGKSAPWNTHLPAAILLFEEIMANPEARPVYRDQPQSKFASILLGIGDPLWTNPGLSNHIWSPAQAGFRFCAGLLIFIDIMASTTLGETPQLLRYHSDMLSQVDDGLSVLGEAEIRLSSIVGCRNWVAMSIAEISAMVPRKRTRRKLNSVPNVQVVDRSHSVTNDLIDNILMIKGSLAASASSYPNYYNPLDLNPLDLGPNPSTSSVLTLIWGLAARLYLLTMTDGWDMGNITIRADVAQIIGLLNNVPHNQLRTLAWPICVAGCLAMESEESTFKVLLMNLSRIQKAGALNDALQIMERVWQMRPTLNDGQWDLISCFAILGSPILLV